MKNCKKYISYIYLLLGVIFYFFYSGRFNVPIMAWIWPALILCFLREDRKFYKPILVFVLFALVGAIKWYGYAYSTFIINVLVGALFGIIPLFTFLVDYFFYDKIKGFKATLLLPLTMASFEFLLQLTPLSTIGSMAATQTGNDQLVQIASIFGSYSISFLVLWFSTTIVYVKENYKGNLKKVLFNAGIYCLIFVCVLIFGGVRLAFSDYSTPSIKIALSTQIYTDPLEENKENIKRDVVKAANGEADIIMFSEEAIFSLSSNENAIVEYVKELAKDNNIYVLLPLDLYESLDENSTYSNKEYLIDNHGEIVFEYYKTNLVPLVEKDCVNVYTKVQNKTLVMPSGVSVKLSSVICMDSDFPSFIRDNVDNVTGILLIPTWDWEYIRAYHTKWVELRAVENGVNLVRCTYDGISTVTDAYGRVTMYSDTASSGFDNIIFTQIKTKPIFTIYKYIGPVLDWCYVAGCLILIVSGLITKTNKQNN